MASPISATIEESRCWTTERVMGSMGEGMGPFNAARHSGAPKGEPGIHSSKMSGGDCWIQVCPLRIAFFDQSNFPLAPPFLQFFLAPNCAYGVIIDFEPDQSID